MTQRVRDGLGLPAGFYRGPSGEPTFFAPNGITADGVESIVIANVTPVSGGRYDWIAYDGGSDAFVPYGDPKPSPTDFNEGALAFCNDIMRAIFNAAQPTGEFPYSLGTSASRANIVDDLANLEADFIFEPG